MMMYPQQIGRTLLKENDAFTPHGIVYNYANARLLVSSKKLQQHYLFLYRKSTVQITVDKPTVIVEFYQEEPDVGQFTQSWLNQIEDGLIEIVPR